VTSGNTADVADITITPLIGGIDVNLYLVDTTAEVGTYEYQLLAIDPVAERNVVAVGVIVILPVAAAAP